MKEVASYLQVDESALQDHQLNSVSDILHLLFDLEDSDMLIPVYVPEWDIYTVRITNSLLRDAVKEWAQNSKSVALGEIDAEAYNRWRELYPSDPFEPTPEEDDVLPFGNEIAFATYEQITDYAYYALVTVLKICQILTKNTDELKEFIDMCGDRKVQMQYRCLMNNALGFIDYELGRMIEQAKITSRAENSNSANSNSEAT